MSRGALRMADADRYLLHLRRIDAGARNGVLDRMACDSSPVGVVEPATDGFGEARPGERDDDRFAHGLVLF